MKSKIRSTLSLLIGPGSVLLLAVLITLTGPAWTAMARSEASVGAATAAQPGDGGAADTAEVSPPRNALVGVWQRRDAWLWVEESGTARLRWRTDWCQDVASGPCDQIDGRGLTVGALAEMRFGTVSDSVPGSTRGQVVSINSSGPLEVGAVSLTRLADDLVVLQQGDRTLALCRSPRDVNFCD